jgi:hypothetical protein
MKLRSTLALLLFACIGVSQNWDWKKPINSFGILQDHAGNVYTYSKPSVSGFTITKMDANGNTLWAKSCTNGTLSALKIDANNNVVVIGNISSATSLDNLQLNPLGQESFFIAKLAPTGAGISQYVYGSSETTFASDIFICSNGDYLVCGGFKGNFNINSYQVVSTETVSIGFFARLNNQQQVLWLDTAAFYTGGEQSFIEECVETTNGNYYISITMYAGLVDLNGYQFQNSGKYLVQLNAGRQVNWAKYVDYPALSYSVWSDIKTAGDTVCMKEYTNHNGVSSQIQVWYPDGTAQTSSAFPAYGIGYDIAHGNIYYAFAHYVGYRSLVSATILQQDSVTGSSSMEDLSFISQGHYYITGNDNGFFAGKFSAAQTTGLLLNEIKSFASVYPNPACEKLSVCFREQADAELFLQDQYGRTLVYAKTNGQTQKQLDLSLLPKGLYLLQIKNGDSKEIRKIVVE